MSMKKNEYLEPYFRDDVVSLEDFEWRITEIKGKLAKFLANNETFKCFYRGDKFCTPTQSKIFRDDIFEIEDSLFRLWQDNCCAKKLGICQCKPQDMGSLLCLAYMQHYCDIGTRLLDFSKDPKIALRFACGDKEKNCSGCRKKVTIYVVESIGVEEHPEIENSFIKLVTSGNANRFLDEYNKKDYFIEMNQNFPRIERQNGLFLFMGNRSSDNNERQNHSTKIKHELSQSDGRGSSYKGYVGVLNIAASAIDEIRTELDKINEYNIKYLMEGQLEDKGKCAECPIKRAVYEYKHREDKLNESAKEV